jgi:hypothetical protein
MPRPHHPVSGAVAAPSVVYAAELLQSAIPNVRFFPHVCIGCFPISLGLWIDYMYVWCILVVILIEQYMSYAYWILARINKSKGKKFMYDFFCIVDRHMPVSDKFIKPIA